MVAKSHYFSKKNPVTYLKLIFNLIALLGSLFVVSCQPTPKKEKGISEEMEDFYIKSKMKKLQKNLGLLSKWIKDFFTIFTIFNFMRIDFPF